MLTGYFDYYNAGRGQGIVEDLYMFRCYRPDGTFGSCHSVPAHEVAANREALIKMGYQEVGNG